MKTHVRIDTFKNYGSNKWYDTFEYDSDIECHDAVKLKEEASGLVPSTSLHFTMEVNSLSSHAWNKYLILRTDGKS